MRILKTLSLALCLSLFAVACGGSDYASSGGTTTQEVSVASSDIESLPQGEKLLIDLSASITYVVSGDLTASERERVEVLTADGRLMPFNGWMEVVYGIGGACVAGACPGVHIHGLGLSQQAGGAPSDGIGTSQEPLKARWKCSSDGRVCMECVFTDYGNLLYCDVYIMPG